MRSYIFMVRDELGDVFRAYGNEFLSGVHEFPSWESDEDPMWIAFLAWEEELVSRANAQCREMYGPETIIFLEETYSSQFRRIPFHGL